MESRSAIDSSWFLYSSKKGKEGDLYVHESLFRETGILAVSPKQASSFESSAVGRDLSFLYKERRYFVEKNSSFQPAEKKHSDVMPNVAIFNPKRRDEIFLPFILGDDENSIGMYIFPWLSNRSRPFEFNGFEEFVTAGCLPSFIGVNEENGKYALIKHVIEFHGKITSIELDSEEYEFNPYEEAHLCEFEKIACFVNQFSAKNKPKLIRYHLPYYDYMLFGIELFIHGKMSFQALDDLCESIVQKKNKRADKIQSICSMYDITPIIESPFENLFGELSIQGNIADNILKTLGYSRSDELDIHLTDAKEKAKEMEERLVPVCLYKLQNNTFNESQRQVWQELMVVNSSNGTEITNLEELFKLGNAVVVGEAARGKMDNTVCSLYPLSEKQIAISYADYSKRYAENLQKKSQSESLAPRREKETHESESKKDKLPHHANARCKTQANKLLTTIYHYNTSATSAVRLAEGMSSLSTEKESCNESRSTSPCLNKSTNQRASKTPSPLYPSIFNATILDMIFPYTRNSKDQGSLFYFERCKISTADLIIKGNILHYASANICLAAQGQKTHTLQEILSDQEKSVELSQQHSTSSDHEPMSSRKQCSIPKGGTKSQFFQQPPSLLPIPSSEKWRRNSSDGLRNIVVPTATGHINKP